MTETQNNTTDVAIENRGIIEYLGDTFDENERRAMIRDMFIVTQVKTITTKVEEGYTDFRGETKTKMVTMKRKMNVYEAVAYIGICRQLDFNPALNSVIMLEDSFYITLEGHKQYAQSTGLCMGIDATLTDEKEMDIPMVKWEKEGGKNVKKVTLTKGKQYTYSCIVKKKVGDEVVEYKGIGVADYSNVAGGDGNSDLKLRQMAEARSKRRALSDAFPPGVGHIEDVTEYPDYNI